MRLNDQFGVEAIERDGSDPDDDAPPHLTGDYRHSLVQTPTYSYVEKRKHKSLTPSARRD